MPNIDKYIGKNVTFSLLLIILLTGTWWPVGSVASSLGGPLVTR